VQSVLGAICVYLLMGMLFTFLYRLVAVLGSGPLFAEGTDGTPAIRLYFSFVTLTTVGYGDYAPLADIARTLANMEALFGQLYLVTVIGVLVSRIPAVRRAQV
jgi:Ion channel